MPPSLLSLLSLGYVDIGLIPKGARDIRVMEIKAAGNFLAIRSEDPEKYYLNGGFIIQWNGNYKLAGTVFQYDRKGDLEKLMAPGPTNESVWIQVTLKRRKLLTSLFAGILLISFPRHLMDDVNSESLVSLTKNREEERYLCCFFFVL